MRKRNTPIRMITVRPAQPRERTTMLALVRRFGFIAGARGANQEAPGRELQSDGLDLDQRVRAIGEW